MERKRERERKIKRETDGLKQRKAEESMKDRYTANCSLCEFSYAKDINA